MPGANPLPGQADLLFVLLPDSWGQTAVALSCPMLMTECPLKLQQLRAVMLRPQGFWQTRVARGSSCGQMGPMILLGLSFWVVGWVFLISLLQCASFPCSALHLLLFLSPQVTASPPFCRCCTQSARTSLSQTCCLDSSLMGQWG